MKKILSLLLSVLLTIGAVLPAFADAADSALIEKLILTAKEKLAIDDNEMEFRHYYLNASEGENSYALYWEAKDENTYKDIHVVLSESGIIQSYYLYEDKTEAKPSFSKYTQQEATQAARAFIEKIDPEKLAETADGTCERNYDGAYTVSFNRVHNDIPVSGNFLTCTVDSNTLKITGYNAVWQSLAFAEGTPISPEAAQEAYCNQAGYELFYQITSEDYENTAHLIYRSRYDENVMIDALTGEAVTHREVYAIGRDAAKAMNESAADSAGGASLSAVEQALVEQVTRMLSREKADQIARGLSELGIT
ncbi:MAG: YcdB/YcdC domain-containing protein, partial [Clostridia bacterium]